MSPVRCLSYLNPHLLEPSNSTGWDETRLEFVATCRQIAQLEERLRDLKDKHARLVGELATRTVEV